MTLFQTAVRADIGFGVPGELAFSGPHRAKTGVLKSTDEKNNVFGRAFTRAADGHIQAGGDGFFWGILAHPKEHTYTARIGDTDGGTYIPNGIPAAFVDMGSITVALTNKANVGDKLWYNTTTGEITAAAPDVTELDGHKLVPNTIVKPYLQQEYSPDGLVVAQMTN